MRLDQSGRPKVTQSDSPQAASLQVQQKGTPQPGLGDSTDTSDHTPSIMLSGTFLHSHTLRAPVSGIFLHSHTLRASVSGTFLHSHTLRASFSGTFLHSHTLRASVSGAFLQTLPELVTPLKGHSIFISAQLSADAVSVLRNISSAVVMYY